MHSETGVIRSYLLTTRGWLEMCELQTFHGSLQMCYKDTARKLAVAASSQGCYKATARKVVRVASLQRCYKSSARQIVIVVSLQRSHKATTQNR